MYIDPNTGGQLFQMLAASLAVITGVIFTFSAQIRAQIAKLRRKNKEEDKE